MTIEVGGGSGAGGTLGEIQSFVSNAAMIASVNFLPLDGKTYLWADYADFATAVNNIPPVINITFLSGTASELGSAHGGAQGGFKSFGTDIWAFPSNTSQKLTTVTGATWSAAASADISIATAAIPFQVQFRADDGGEGCLVISNTANSIIDYTTVSALTSGWTAIDLNATISLTASSKCEGITNSGASGRWYSLWSNTTNLQIAYSAVDDVSTGWTLWGGTVTSGHSTNITDGSIAVNEGSMYMWSSTAQTSEIQGKIYGAATLGGVASLLLDISPTIAMYFHLSYDIDEGIFIAMPSVKSYPTYTSSDNGTTWLAGDTNVSTPIGKMVKYDSTENIYLSSIVSTGNDDELFIAWKRDAAGYMRKITVQQTDGNSVEYIQSIANNISYHIAANPDVGLGMVGKGNTGAYNMLVKQNLTTEFATMNVFNYKGADSNNGGIGLPIGNYLGMRVKT